MTFYEVVEAVLVLLKEHRRVTYRALKRQFALDDDYIEDLKAELIQARRLAIDEQGTVLVWSGDTGGPRNLAAAGVQPPPSALQVAHRFPADIPLSATYLPEAERRQLTVLFCDLVNSTTLASQLDPEEWREVVRAYQATCAKVIARFEGHIAQYLGDGLLVYFGYPQAHEDDAQRAVRAGLGIIAALTPLNTRLTQEHGVHLAARLGIHTGLVVVGDVGGGSRQEQLALGETPNLAARLQELAAPNTLVVSAATLQLLKGFFAYQSLGTSLLRGLAQPLEVYQILSESTARSRLDMASSTAQTRLVGREREVELLLERWTQVKDGLGQVVLLSGEAGIGKSRLVQVLEEHVATEAQAWLTPCQCSPYHQHTALYPLIDLLERMVLYFDREEPLAQKLSKLEGLLVQYGLPLPETMPLFTALLSLPLPTAYAPLTISPEQQKQKTLHILLTILLRIAEQQPLLFVMEDLHWVDPTTLELLSLLVDQGPTARILVLLTFRADFSPPWTGRSHLTHITLPRLLRHQVAEMADQVARRKALPPEVVAQVTAKTDGVPLFIEELTKMVLESGLLQEREGRYELASPLPSLAIPMTLHDSLMARLDRLAMAKAIAQLGATLGREFSYALLQAVAPWEEGMLRQGLRQLVDVELLYRQGLPPQALYRFKHALIQDAAYQSLLRSTRQQHHQHIAQVLEAQFPDLCETQPELLAHHYTEAGLLVQAIAYWQRAGQRSIQRSAHFEAIEQLTRGLELLKHLPNTPERTQQELTLQTAMGLPLLATRGMAAPEVEHTYARARALCRQLGDTPQLFSVLWGLWWFYEVRGEMQTARELAEQLLNLAQGQADAALLIQAHRAMGQTAFWMGELPLARTHLEQVVALYDPAQHHTLAFQYGEDPRVGCLSFLAHVLWYLGYPERALTCGQEAVSLAQAQAHPFSLAHALASAAWLHHYRREGPATQERIEAAMTLCHEQGFPFFLSQGMILRGWALTEQEQDAAGIAQMQQGISANMATGAEIERPYFLALLATAQAQGGHTEEGLRMLTEALRVAQQGGICLWEAELYRLLGELRQRQAVPDLPGARAVYLQALDIARRQQAMALALRAATSLSRLLQYQGQPAEARQLLTPIYGCFTEGLNTADLCEARALLTALA